MVPIFGQEKLSFSGKITDSLNQPIRSAQIVLQPDHILAVSNQVGEFKTEKIYQGTYQFQITAAGYQTKTGKINLGPDSLFKQFILGASEKEIEEITVLGKQVYRPTLIDPVNGAMPVKIIDRKTLDLLGSRRLDEVLREQTGMAIVNNISGGNRSVGIQMQGLSSQYIMILMDGQPLLGRQSGNLDLSRINVSNIERIEIIKGASSCLYGNDALGGAINIITRFGTNSPQLHLQSSYGSFNTFDLTAEAESNFHKNKGYILLSANYYQTDGFNNNKKYLSSGTTIPPYNNLALQGKIRHQIGSAGDHLSLNFRYNNRVSHMTRNYLGDYEISDNQQENDFNTSIQYDKRWTDQWKSLTTYYYSLYESQIKVDQTNQQATLSSDQFNQQIHRFEQQLAYNGSRINFNMGALIQVEAMQDQGYRNYRNQYNIALYGQGNYQLGNHVKLIGGLRYDHTLNYGAQVSPSLGIDYEISNNLNWKTGIAWGFKAPDFRTRYQIFYNPAANYYVIGNEVLAETLAEMSDRAELSEIRKAVVEQLKDPLKPEKNRSINTGITYRPTSGTTLDVNIFYHRLDQQINSIQVATGMRNLAIYSYQNLPKAVNKGLEVNMQSSLGNFSISGGYQYLIAKDLGVIDHIQAGDWPYSQNLHDPNTGNSYPVSSKDYWGLENRSRHQFNAGVVYHYPIWDLTLNFRAIFRGRYPFMDSNGNQFIDRYDVFVDDHIIYHAGMEKRFEKLPLSLSFHVENLSNYINYLIPGQTGRSFTIGLSYRILKK